MRYAISQRSENAYCRIKTRLMNSQMAWEHQSSTAEKTSEAPIPIVRLAAMLLTHSMSSQASGDCWAPLVWPGQCADQASMQDLTPSVKPASTLRASLSVERDANAQGGCHAAGSSCTTLLLFHTGILLPWSSITSPHVWPTRARCPFQTYRQEETTLLLASPSPAAPSWSVCPSQRVGGHSGHPRHYPFLPILLLTRPARCCRDILPEEACNIAARGRQVLIRS